MSKIIILFVAFTALLVDYFIGYFNPSLNLNEIRYTSKWIGLGILYGGLIAYVIVVILYKKWKKKD